MSDTLVKLKTGALADIQSEVTVPLDKGAIYFAIDLENHIGKIVYDAPSDSISGTDRIVMSTYADHSAFSEGIPYGEVDSTSTATVFTATVPGITELKDGTVVLLKNGVVTSASGFTININNLGAKPAYNNMTAETEETTIFNISYTMLFIYDSGRGDEGGWICYRGYDANTNTIGYQVRTNYSSLLTADKGYKYRIWFTSADGTKWVPANTSTSTNATATRTPNTRAIDPFGPIIYYSYNGTTNANVVLSPGHIWQQTTFSFGYSFNTTGEALTLIVDKPVYVQCTPNANGSAVINGYTQALPSSKDDKIYILLGIAYSATYIELRLEHPVYYHDGTGIRVWSGAAESDPVFTASAAHGITSADITNWNNKSTFSGNYNDLTNKPTIPTVPSNISAFTNDAGYITSADVPEGASAYTGTISAIGTTASAGTNNGFARGDHVHNITGSTITNALGYTPYNSTNPNGYTTNTGTITSIKTTAGKHTTINVSSGAANFNVPTNTSHLTNDSGFITSSDVVTYTAGTGIDITNGVISINLSNAESENF